MRESLKPARLAWALVLLSFAAQRATPEAAAAGKSLDNLAIQAVQGDDVARSRAIDALRDAGPAGLDALWVAHQDIIETAAGRGSVARRIDTSEWQRIRQALDAVGGQRDCHTSRLYWYTDLEQAKAAASEAGKPILSLRLLGKLTDEFSCANSRFFRSALYANTEVGRALRERFVLHWQSVRPVPIVTIDFGDGRKLERTVTGNSVHYILGAQGQPLDALPGLYGPKAFLSGIAQAEGICRELAVAGADRLEALRRYHRVRLMELEGQWVADQTLALRTPAPLAGSNAAVSPTGTNSSALEPAVDFSCSAEPVLDLPQQSTIVPLVALSDPALLEPSSDALWAKIAELHAENGQLDAASLRVIRRQNPAAAARAAMSKRVVENPLLRLIGGFQQAMALDTVRNEYLLHRQIHEWFVQQPAAEIKSLNERVYAELFLTPNSDPWLGLLPADSYSGLEQDGAVTQTAAN